MAESIERRVNGWLMGLAGAAILGVGASYFDASKRLTRIEALFESQGETLNSLRQELIASTVNRYDSNAASRDRASIMDILAEIRERVDANDKRLDMIERWQASQTGRP